MINPRLSRGILVATAIAGSTGVIFGSLSAHGLPELLGKIGLPAEDIPKRCDQFETAVRYQLIHTLALLGLSGVAVGRPKARLFAACMFIAGISLFCGSLYAMAFLNDSRLGAITPLGGLCWVTAWLGMAWVAMPRRRDPDHDPPPFEVGNRELVNSDVDGA